MSDLDTLKEVYDKWQTDFEFRSEFAKDPESALKNAGFEVTKDLLKKLKESIELDKRINK